MRRKADAWRFTQELLRPTSAPERTRLPDREGTEAQIQKSIVDWLLIQEALGKLFFSRINVIPVKDGDTYRALPSGVKRGFPDIVVCLDGRFIGIEVKRGTGGKQSEAQRECQRQIEAGGGTYLLVNDLEQVRRALSL